MGGRQSAACISKRRVGVHFFRDYRLRTESVKWLTVLAHVFRSFPVPSYKCDTEYEKWLRSHSHGGRSSTGSDGKSDMIWMKLSFKGFQCCWLRFITSNTEIKKNQIKNGGPKCKKWLVSDKTWYLMVSEFYNYDFQLIIKKITIVNLIWRTKEKRDLIQMKLGSQGSSRSSIMNRNSKLRISKCRIQYGWSKCKKWLNLNETWYLRGGSQIEIAVFVLRTAPWVGCECQKKCSISSWNKECFGLSKSVYLYSLA